MSKNIAEAKDFKIMEVQETCETCKYFSKNIKKQDEKKKSE